MHFKRPCLDQNVSLLRRTPWLLQPLSDDIWTFSKVRVTPDRPGKSRETREPKENSHHLSPSDMTDLNDSSLFCQPDLKPLISSRCIFVPAVLEFSINICHNCIPYRFTKDILSNPLASFGFAGSGCYLLKYLFLHHFLCFSFYSSNIVLRIWKSAAVRICVS